MHPADFSFVGSFFTPQGEKRTDKTLVRFLSKLTAN